MDSLPACWNFFLTDRIFANKHFLLALSNSFNGEFGSVKKVANVQTFCLHNDGIKYHNNIFFNLRAFRNSSFSLALMFLS